MPTCVILNDDNFKDGHCVLLIGRNVDKGSGESCDGIPSDGDGLEKATVLIRTT